MNETILSTKATRILILALMAGLLVIVGIFAANGCYQVKPGEAAAIRVFGKAKPEPVTQEGLHWNWPGPIGKTDVRQVQKNRTAEIGYATLPEGKISVFTGENWQRDLEEATMITGDLNLVEIQMVAQYYISDLHKYMFSAADPGISFEYLDEQSKSRTYQSHPEGAPDGRSLKDALSTALRRAAGKRTIDEVLITQREAIELETMRIAQEILQKHQTGLTITAVQLQEVKAPDAVQAAFDDVLRAREERDTRINLGLAFEQQVIPRAKGQAGQTLNEAKAYRARRIAQAMAEANRFTNILDEYQSSPEIIQTRMWMETMDEILPKLQLIMVTGDDTPPVIINGTDGRSGRITPVNLPTTADPE